jgi:hypothetical protein
MTDVLAIPTFPIQLPHGWTLPVIAGCVALVVVLVAGSMLANRRARKKRDQNDKRDQ